MIQHHYHSPIAPVAARKRGRLATHLSTLLLVSLLVLLLTACGDIASPAQSDGSGSTNQAITAPQPTAPQDTTDIDPTLPTRPTLEPIATEPAMPATPTPERSTASAPTATRPVYPAPERPGTGEGTLLFLRDGTLMAYELGSGQERRIAPNVREFAATPDGSTLALVRAQEAAADEVWLVARDGSNLRQVTSNNRAEGSLSWAPDGRTLVYASSTMSAPYPPDWQSWSEWCSSSEIRLLDTASSTETPLEAGCEPAFSNDGRRIAFATPPQEATLVSSGIDTKNGENAIRLVNRQGENGWNFAIAEGEVSETGYLVYAPIWSPDSAQLAYHRFVGYQALVDINYIEMGGSFQGDGDLLGQGAGWLLPARFAPDGSAMSVVEYNYSSARGLGGYNPWSVQVLQPGQRGEVILPSGTRETDAVVVDSLPFVTAAAWSPDGSELVVSLPPGWSSALAEDDQRPVQVSGAGEVWRWSPGSLPGERLVSDVDFASPLLWLP
jgi:Tol biopolymer transport system component